MRWLALPTTFALVAAALGCGDEPARYELTVSFNTSVTQVNLEEAEALLRAYDDGLEFLIQESFPPTGRATLRTDAAGFCPTVETELEAKTYIDAVMCEEREEPTQSGEPDQPVESPWRSS